MAPVTVLPQSENLQALRLAIQEMDSLFTPEGVNFVALAKCFQGTAEALLATLEENQSASIRFTAVVKALDLRTPKSQLQAFVNGG